MISSGECSLQPLREQLKLREKEKRSRSVDHQESNHQTKKKKITIQLLSSKRRHLTFHMLRATKIFEFENHLHNPFPCFLDRPICIKCGKAIL